MDPLSFVEAHRNFLQFFVLVVVAGWQLAGDTRGCETYDTCL